MIAAEQKARVTYDNLIRLIDDPDILDPLKFLRQREITHYQRFGEAQQSMWNAFGGAADKTALNKAFLIHKRRIKNETV